MRVSDFLEAETIAGNLCRRDDGEFSACGAASSAAPSKTPPKAGPTPDKPSASTSPKGREKVTQEIAKKLLPVDWKEITYEDLSKTLAAVKDAGGKPDLCVMDPPVCRGNFGKDRIEMPQFPGERVPDLLAGLKAKGVEVSDEEVPVGKLKATQDEINASKVIGMVGAMEAGTFKPGAPAIISNDDYVLDGHHRWAAQWLRDRDSKLSVIRIDMPMEELLNFADQFSGKKKGFDEAKGSILTNWFIDDNDRPYFVKPGESTLGFRGVVSMKELGELTGVAPETMRAWRRKGGTGSLTPEAENEIVRTECAERIVNRLLNERLIGAYGRTPIPQAGPCVIYDTGRNDPTRLRYFLLSVDKEKVFGGQRGRWETLPPDAKLVGTYPTYYQALVAVNKLEAAARRHY